MPGTLARRRQFLGDACQCGKIVTLLGYLLFVFKVSYLPNYRIKYYTYIVKLRCGVACNWCVSLGIAFILALTSNETVPQRHKWHKSPLLPDYQCMCTDASVAFSQLVVNLFCFNNGVLHLFF